MWQAGGDESSVVDFRFGPLQRSRTFLYKTRMSEPLSAFSRTFFRSLGDAAEFLRLFDYLPNVFLYVKDAEGRFVALNQARLDMWGVRHAEEVIGKTDLDLHPIYWGKQYRDEDRKVIRAGEPLANQVWLVPVHDGSLRTFVSSKIPLRDRSGHCIGIAGVMYPLDPLDPSDDRSNDGPIDVAVRKMLREFQEPIEIKSLAEEVGLSVSQLNRRFRARYQMSPSEYLQRVRIHEACRLLADTDDSIAEVAHDTGFYDQAHLTRTFKKWREMTPSEFRRASRGESR